MKVDTVSVVLLMMALFFILAVAAQVFLDAVVEPKTVFVALLVGTILTGIASLAVNFDIPT